MQQLSMENEGGMQLGRNRGFKAYFGTKELLKPLFSLGHWDVFMGLGRTNKFNVSYLGRQAPEKRGFWLRDGERCWKSSNFCLQKGILKS